MSADPNPGNNPDPNPNPNPNYFAIEIHRLCSPRDLFPPSPSATDGGWYPFEGASLGNYSCQDRSHFIWDCWESRLCRDRFVSYVLKEVETRYCTEL